MKGGSYKIVFLAVIYIVITLVVFLIFGPLGKNKTVKAGGNSGFSDERIIGDAGYSNSGAYGLDNSDGSGSAGGSDPSDASGEGGSNGTEGSLDASGASGSEGGSGQDKTIHYYRFTVVNIASYLRVREEGSLSAKVIGRFKNGREGYVLERGDEWSLIVSKKGEITGYCSNEFLEFTEISKDEFPKEYVDRVK